ncbi:Asp-tRNA(Asn)/Glu-tRNA(Gln) amidotransferase subunit GatC [Candidatus Saccharibacteria bacterium]|jgi:aspartyl-tRNA(Asn)/glutamyl-tRNA(Gln) amidotransferase subunit C|nr:Asp-tRNA(Asn)/Glu-tRNA(Gln) amidotransferase subunit GatC [Candidatus Saccharibacteria bacterium]
MEHVTVESLGQLAELSALELGAQEAEDLAADIEKIISYIDQMSELDTEGVKPTYQVTDLYNVWRQDEIDLGTTSGQALLDLANDNVAQDQIKVPKVL